ncbi:uncharacterized protein LOC123011380 [Tribolium madens]|uniref:uncharacterized protein LOC123011380 n=1 Tax=Tribolium madens TaxID=41895 RepID=UPI001CF7646D|nr:uncharacterized protein LOC123011380 [Tribolium madens]
MNVFFLLMLLRLNHETLAKKNKITTSPKCDGPGFYPTESCSNYYYECKKHGFFFWTFKWTATLKTCPDEKVFNSIEKSCVSNSCSEESALSTKINKTAAQSSTLIYTQNTTSISNTTLMNSSSTRNLQIIFLVFNYVLFLIS